MPTSIFEVKEFEEILKEWRDKAWEGVPAYSGIKKDESKAEQKEQHAKDVE